MANQGIPRRGIVVLALAFCTLAADRAAGQSILLKPQLEEGGKYYVERLVSVTQQIAHGAGGAKLYSVSGAIEEVESVSKEGTKLVLTLDRLGFRTGSKEIGSFDSDLDDKGQSEALAPILREMVGSRLTLTLDKRGVVKSCKGAKEIAKKVEKSVSGNAAAAALWTTLFKNGVDNENYKSNWGSSRFVLYPNKEVKVGDAWKNSYEEKDAQLGNLRYDFDVKLDSVKETEGGMEAVVSYSGTVSKTGGGGEGKVTFQSGDMTGTATFSSKRGQFVTCEQRGKIAVETASAQGGRTVIQVFSEETINIIGLKRREEQKQTRAQGATKTEKTDKPSKDK